LINPIIVYKDTSEMTNHMVGILLCDEKMYFPLAKFLVFFIIRLRTNLRYLTAKVSRACKLMKLFYVVFCLVRDGHKLYFGLVIN